MRSLCLGQLVWILMFENKLNKNCKISISLLTIFTFSLENYILNLISSNAIIYYRTMHDHFYYKRQNINLLTSEKIHYTSLLIFCTELHLAIFIC